jgi:hypothetical protein
VTPLNDITAAGRAISDFRIAFTSKLPDDIKEDLAEIDASPSPVSRMVGVMELLYARYADIPAEGRDLVASLAGFCSSNGWHGLLDDNRGGKIAMAMIRENNSVPAGLPTQPKESDPKPKPEYALPEAIEPTVMPVPTPDTPVSS